MGAALIHADGRTDTAKVIGAFHDFAKVIGAFRDFAKAPKKSDIPCNSI